MPSGIKYRCLFLKLVDPVPEPESISGTSGYTDGMSRTDRRNQ